ncbi:hypothetical protein SK128_001129 [Halocaridina rubra]|uniref:Uncharacterized protein n=1 Tax=Halocaridina rubra TaxID=373956 RepID=A0AAN8WBF1_HALRR
MSDNGFLQIIQTKTISATSVLAWQPCFPLPTPSVTDDSRLSHYRNASCVAAHLKCIYSCLVETFLSLAKLVLLNDFVWKYMTIYFGILTYKYFTAVVTTFPNSQKTIMKNDTSNIGVRFITN